MTREEIQFVVEAARQAGADAIEYQKQDAVLKVAFADANAPREVLADRPGDAAPARAPKPDVVKSPRMGTFSLTHPGGSEPPAAPQNSAEARIVGYVIARDVVFPVVAEAGKAVAARVENGAVVGYGDALFDYVK